MILLNFLIFFVDHIFSIKKKKDDFDILVTQGAGSVSNICQIIKNQWEK